MAHQPITSAKPLVPVGYLRRSTDRQEQSIPDQKKAIERYAESHGLRMHHYYTDDAISGTSSIGRRAFQQMLADAQRPGRAFSLIVVYDVKRFGRVGNDEAGYYRHVLSMHGVEVRYVSENFSGDGTDDLLRPVKQWQAREESKDLSKVTIRGLLSRVDSGCWMGGVPPYGYDLRYEDATGKFLLILRHLPDGTKLVLNQKGKRQRSLVRGESLNISKRDRARLVFSEAKRVEAIKELFGMYVAGKGFKAIADTFNRRNLPTPRGAAWSHIYHGKWTDSTIRAILLNPIYMGDMVWNRRCDGRFHKIGNRQALERKDVHGARLVPNAEAEWITVKDAHPAIITRKQFEQAKRLRESRPASAKQRGINPRAVGNWHGQRSRFILSGLMTCARCGNRYQGYTCTKGKRRNDGTAVKSYFYACGGYITKGSAVCQLGAIDQEKLEKAVIEAVSKHYRQYLEGDGPKRLKALVKQALGCEQDEVDAKRKGLLAQQAKLKKTMSNLLDNITAANREMIDQRLSELQAEQKEIASKVEQLESMSFSQVEYQAMLNEIEWIIQELPTILGTGYPEDKRLVLRKCILAISIDVKSLRFAANMNKLPTDSGENTQIERITIEL